MSPFLSLEHSLSPMPDRSLEHTDTRPEVGLRTPAAMLSRVLLPLPDLPTIVTNSPSSRSRLTWSTALNGRTSREYSITMSSSSSTLAMSLALPERRVRVLPGYPRG